MINEQELQDLLTDAEFELGNTEPSNPDKTYAEGIVNALLFLLGKGDRPTL